jgi:hypothetical protein
MPVNAWEYPTTAAAFAALSAAGGGRLNFGPGTFPLDLSAGNPLQDAKVPIEICGEGKATIFTAASPSQPATLYLAGDTGNLVLRDFAILGPANTGTAAIRVATTQPGQMTFETHGVGISGGGGHGVQIDACNAAVLDGLYCNFCHGIGLWLNGGGDEISQVSVGNVFVRDYQCSALGIDDAEGIRLCGVNGFYLAQADIEGIGVSGNGSAGIAIAPAAGQLVMGVRIWAATVADIAGIGWAFAPAEGGYINDVQTYGCQGIGCNADCMLLGGGNTGNMSGIEHHGYVGNGSLSGSGVHYQNGVGASGVRFFGGSCDGNAYDGYYLGGGGGPIDGVTLDGVSASANGAWGVECGKGTVKNYAIRPLQLVGNKAGSILDPNKAAAVWTP